MSWLSRNFVEFSNKITKQGYAENKMWNTLKQRQVAKPISPTSQKSGKGYSAKT